MHVILKIPSSQSRLVGHYDDIPVVTVFFRSFFRLFGYFFFCSAWCSFVQQFLRLCSWSALAPKISGSLFWGENVFLFFLCSCLVLGAIAAVLF